MFNPRLVLAAFATVVLAAACRPEPPPPAAPEPTGPTAEEIEAQRIADSIENARRLEAEALAAAQRAEREMQQRAAAARATLGEMVYFDYDESTLTSETTRTLQAKLAVLRSCPSVRLRMEGHADERGTSEYNIALGSERAQSVSEFFTGFGLDDARFSTVSYGEERPVAQGSNEAAWARNRRVEFVITTGADDLGRCQS
ncbi:MAG: peptidoglycan-associated lipoprotein Pal [Gemmatimonadetes bacterium]|nr:peptidoglycan-associated lipoprotein Pal [Gemmatimonadota bacterium]MYA64655.1 peptidoglycan-associated lipoprotein Pal [Gemmatimonadota bacterium]MYB99377.1 peptidoglycan-associated lipoprotein Pal [Gemmatimonadota bacterium]MYH51986.1 peptidoglycan-associated lipoprotein Pal [Gemmatimonadota bacterium]MYK65785.1 peptidoglycan-associated lipoprotein Pal [Gemmatimonadota bacterium]